MSCCAHYAGESLFDLKTEADSNDITEHPHDDKPIIESRGLCVTGIMDLCDYLYVQLSASTAFLHN